VKRWTVVWSDVCVGDVRRMPWRLAADICAAVLDFAASGRGIVERTRLKDPNRLRIRVRGAEADVRCSVETRTLYVIRIHERR
jgi:hypothetical protein